ncbi:MAG TPA: hypothetical protein VGE43_07690, partial [Acidimicrobiales bacterium]
MQLDLRDRRAALVVVDVMAELASGADDADAHQRDLFVHVVEDAVYGSTWRAHDGGTPRPGAGARVRSVR